MAGPAAAGSDSQPLQTRSPLLIVGCSSTMRTPGRPFRFKHQQQGLRRRGAASLWWSCLLRWGWGCCSAGGGPGAVGGRVNAGRFSRLLAGSGRTGPKPGADSRPICSGPRGGADPERYGSSLRPGGAAGRAALQDAGGKINLFGWSSAQWPLAGQGAGPVWACLRA